MICLKKKSNCRSKSERELNTKNLIVFDVKTNPIFIAVLPSSGDVISFGIVDQLLGDVDNGWNEFDIL